MKITFNKKSLNEMNAKYMEIGKEVWSEVMTEEQMAQIPVVPSADEIIQSIESEQLAMISAADKGDDIEIEINDGIIMRVLEFYVRVAHIIRPAMTAGMALSKMFKTEQKELLEFANLKRDKHGSDTLQ